MHRLAQRWAEEDKIMDMKGFEEAMANITKSEDKQLGIFFIDKNGLVEQGNVDHHDKEKVKEFAYKIFEYLWDDVLKYCRENWFGKEIKSLDDLIKEYIEKADRKQGAEVFVNGIFKENK